MIDKHVDSTTVDKSNTTLFASNYNAGQETILALEQVGAPRQDR